MTAPDLIPIETLFSTPEFSRAQISPDGRLVAYLAPWRGRLNIWVQPTGQGAARRLTGDDTRNIDGFSWTRDARYILFVQDSRGDENWHLHRVEVDGAETVCGKALTVDLTPFAGVRVMGLDFSAALPGKAFVQMNLRSPGLIDLYEVDIENGETRIAAESPDRFVRWIVTPNGPMHAFIIDDAGDHELARYENGTFTTLAKLKGRDQPIGPMPLMVAADGKSIFVGCNTGSDHTYLAAIDLATGRQRVIDSLPDCSLDTPRPEADTRFPSSLITNPVTGELLGLRYLGIQQKIRSLSPHFAAVLDSLQRLSDGEIGHISCDAGGEKWVVEFWDDRHPGTTWLYDHVSGDARVLGERFAEISAERLASVHPVDVTSRDGLTLPCHVTLPVGYDAEDEPRALPTVLLVHGGPWYRDACVYDAEVQFLANRGYAVLQVNFRGSTGYGKAFMQAAIGEFSGRMHDDLIDGLDWLIGQGIADPARVAIYGCSYGGYAALVGASFTPERFAAAIDYSGMSDLRVLVDGAVPFVRPALINTYLAYMGDPDIEMQNRDMLARSPVSRLDCISKPLLVIHGANDVRVAQAQADVVVETVRASGVEVDYLLNEREGHWFINEDSNIELYQRIERFLARHLRGEH
ncbi:Dipeptidyl aminopeptidase/acylaminoacyl peptidase [Rhizobium sp. NFR07]|uniref:S9 family peptidase n=1 Tax=Rhizobium sp. NFR07 TaxID=1566262 RepID=UPI0008DEC12D|nr:S9 family peptidase [Rhizobium sp. NFR07]SFB56625.1 Dipeptidyl aminopeptidase/acylaminoacyl peptidase [Rhizobium sp. NFR07]